MDIFLKLGVILVLVFVFLLMILFYIVLKIILNDVVVSEDIKFFFLRVFVLKFVESEN